MPRFSIFTPTRNRPDWIARCVESVRSQDEDGDGFTDWEHIIFDNGDLDVADQLPLDDPRIKLVKGTAKGPADAFNQALELCTGEIVHPLSDDDRLAEGALEVVDAALHPHAASGAEWLVGLTRIEDVEGNEIQTFGERPWPVRLRTTFRLGGGVYWLRELSDRVGGFNPDFDSAADWDLYLRFAENARAVWVNRVLYLYTDHPGTDSNVNQARQLDAGRRIKGLAA